MLRVLVTVGTLATIVGWSGAADAKKAKKLKMDPTVPETPEPTGPVPPEADAAGHVNFGNPQAEGLGRVTVKSEGSEKIQVYLDGRYFGDTPVTIYSVPKGDYIVEGTIVSSGKQISKPVSVMENEEATVELGNAKPDANVAAASGSTFTLGGGELSDRRKLVAKVCLGVGAVALVTGVVFAILTSGAESDFEKTSVFDVAAQDSIRERGNRDALIANVGFAVTGLAIVGAAVAAYPMFFKPEGDKTSPEAKTTAFRVAPMFGRGTTGGALSFQF